PNEWGSSDPALWHKSLRKAVRKPQALFKAPTFAAIAESAIAERQWGLAMWAARLCVALEDQQTGEQLTDTILDQGEVHTRLRRIVKAPGMRDTEFGKPFSVQQWIDGSPEDYIIDV